MKKSGNGALLEAVLAAGVLLSPLCGRGAGQGSGQSAPAPAAAGWTMKASELENANDPWVVERNGRYYYCLSRGRAGRAGVAVAELKDMPRVTARGAKVVWTAPESGPYSKELWAPELHYLRGRWYIYVAADDGNNHNHRMIVLRAKTDDPTGPFEFAGFVKDTTDKWAIDGTVLEAPDGELYFVWSGWEGDTNVAQNIYIAHMSSPVAIDGPRVLLSKPEHPWEKRDSGGGLPTINEGPAALVRGKTVHIVYSASGSWADNYCLGLLTCRNGRFLDPKSWTKSGEPVFSRAPGANGPGHCSFFRWGGRDWIAYHANRETGKGWGGRSGRWQPFRWRGDVPDFGSPAPVVEDKP